MRHKHVSLSRFRAGRRRGGGYVMRYNRKRLFPHVSARSRQKVARQNSFVFPWQIGGAGGGCNDIKYIKYNFKIIVLLFQLLYTSTELHFSRSWQKGYAEESSIGSAVYSAERGYIELDGATQIIWWLPFFWTLFWLLLLSRRFAIGRYHVMYCTTLKTVEWLQSWFNHLLQLP